MKFALCIVALTFMVSVEAVPAPLTPAIVSPTNGKEYFKKKLESIQGAIDDTIEAGKDLQDMEKALQDIVNLSSFFWLTESATEYATATDKYTNLWKPACTTQSECENAWNPGSLVFVNIRGCTPPDDTANPPQRADCAGV